MNVAAHYGKENENTGKRKAQKEESTQSTVSKRLHAALLCSFREQHGEILVCMNGVSCITGTHGKANSHFGPAKTGSLRRLLIRAERFSSLIFIAESSLIFNCMEFLLISI